MWALGAKSMGYITHEKLKNLIIYIKKKKRVSNAEMGIKNGVNICCGSLTYYRGLHEVLEKKQIHGDKKNWEIRVIPKKGM